MELARAGLAQSSARFHSMAFTSKPEVEQAADRPNRPGRFDDRMLAEATATWEQLDQRSPSDREANNLARESGGDFEQRLIFRAHALPHADDLREAQRHVRTALIAMVMAGLLFALLGGIATARAILGVPHEEPVNIFHVLAATLGPQTILLVIWIGVMFAPRSSGALLSIASLGGFIVRGGQWLARRIHPGRTYAAAVGGMSHAFLRGGLGRWTFSSISHALWLAFNVGCLGMMFFLLSTRQYAFAWETTILSEGTYVPLTRAIGSAPRLAGFITPSGEQIAESQWRGEGGHANFDASQAWSGLLVGSIVVYGFAPRVILLGWSLGRRRLAKRRYRLDVERPEFAQLRHVLEPDVASLGVVDARPDVMPGAKTADRVRPSAPPPPAARSIAEAGLPVILGFELPPVADRNHWPPQVHGVRWNDLGMVDSREDRRRVIDDLAQSDRLPAAIVVVCSLTTTPDRGVGAFLAELAQARTLRTVLLLSGGQRLRERNSSPDSIHDGNSGGRRGIEDRLNDWRAIAASANIPAEHVLELDLDHLTQTTQSKLALLLGGRSLAKDASHARHFEDAMDLIIAFAREQDAKPVDLEAKRQAVLHAEIAKLYGDAPPRWRTLLRLPTDVASYSPANIAAGLSSTAKRFSDMLPDRLRRSPKWLAAGATAGALGCVAAAALISPVAIGALPIWSGLGAAVAAVAQPTTRKSAVGGSEDAAASSDLGRTVRSAALFAMLLELQGYDELRITRVLDETVHDDDGDELPTASDVQRWLLDLQHRFDLAMAREARI